MRLSEVAMGEALAYACGSGHAECVHHGQLVTQGQGGGSVYTVYPAPQQPCLAGTVNLINPYSANSLQFQPTCVSRISQPDSVYALNSFWPGQGHGVIAFLSCSYA